MPPQAIYLSEPESVRPARRYVLQAAVHQEPSIPDDALDTLELLASELVTNAVRYGQEPGDSLKVTVEASPGRCRVEVHDTRHRYPRAAGLERACPWPGAASGSGPGHAMGRRRKVVREGRVGGGHMVTGQVRLPCR
ncbi:ATP-binding protein [Streptomyces sp. NPDC046631]|uniref:ATP-binding protein n=1 Tax=unclassified Streptomyces TaxID=2593676 RepID=UPI0033E5573C